MAKGKDLEEAERIYFICPVRNRTDEEKKLSDRYVRRLESQGYMVHYPPRDVEQNDPTGGYNIMYIHRSAMEWCTQIRAYWNPTSSGSVGDISMGFFARKPFKLANKRRIEEWLKSHPEIPKSHTHFAYVLDNLLSKEVK